LENESHLTATEGFAFVTLSASRNAHAVETFGSEKLPITVIAIFQMDIEFHPTLVCLPSLNEKNTFGPIKEGEPRSVPAENERSAAPTAG
jgi:hypothetical protein